MTKNIWLIGAAAGFATVLLLVSATVTAGGSFLTFFVPLPSLIVGLGWGWPVAGIAGLTGAIFFFLVSSGVGGLVYAILVAVPATLMAQVAGLWRPAQSTGSNQSPSPNNAAGFVDSYRQPPPVGQENQVEWYPLSRILMWLVLLAAGLAIFSTFTLGTDDLTYKAAVYEVVDDFIERHMKPVLKQDLTVEQTEALKEFAAKLLPAMVASAWMFLMILNTWIGAKVARASGMMKRPAPDMRMAGLPQGVIFGLGVMLLATSLGGLPGRAAMGFVGAAVFAILLIGLAVVHEWTIGNPARLFMLSIVYVGLMFLSVFTVPPLLAIGLAEPFFRFRDKIRARRQSLHGPPD